MADFRTPDYQSFLYAYALGCLDKDDFIQFVEHLESGESFSWQEMGEFQNLSALLPSFLNVEEPAPQVKDKVARRLYRLKDEKKQAPPPPAPPVDSMPGNPFARTQSQYHSKMKTMIIEAAPKPAPVSERITIPDDEIMVPTDFKPEAGTSPRPTDVIRPQQDTQVRHRAQQEAPERPPQPEDRSEFTDFAGLNMPDAEAEQPKENLDEFIINHTGYAESGNDLNSATEKQPAQKETAKTASAPGSPDLEAIRRQVVENVNREDVPPIEPIEVKAGISPVVFAITVLLLFAAVGGLYYYLSPKFQQTQADMSKLREEFQAKVTELNRNSEVSVMLATKNSYVVTLHGSNRYPEAYGQFIYNRDSKRGIIMYANLPATAPETGYQLWYEINDKKIPVGAPVEFGNGGMKIEYFSIPAVPSFPSGEKALMYITIEKLNTTPELPSKEKFLDIEAILN